MKTLFAAALLFAATPAAAEVVERSADGFTLRYVRPVAATSPAVNAAMAQVGDWWDSAHTYSGDAHNISVDLRPGGCWCERLAGGQDFRHATVVGVESGRLAFDAPFGPLNGKADRADFTVIHADGSVTWTMVIEGPGLGAYADGVDAVMGAGFDRFVAWLDVNDD